jgi:phenylacetic acid degradation operon negative regulatory protein
MSVSFESVLKQAQARRKLRVWSLIMTFFGDAIVPRGGAVSAQTIQLVMQQFHISPGAVRTAFSRLTNDGWVIREKYGRNSFYRLSETGYDPFAKASERIYDAPFEETPNERLVIAIAPNALGDTKATKTHAASPSIQLFDRDHPDIAERISQNWFVMDAEPRSVPDWLHAELMPQELADAFDELTRQFEHVDVSSPIEAIALRTLLIHEWRRFLLRTPTIPNGILPNSAPIRQCRRQVKKTYQDCLELSEQWLTHHGEGPNGSLPEPQNLYDRF